MSTWEERMSAKAHTRLAADARMEGELASAAWDALQNVPADDWVTYEGTCDVCSGNLRFRHSMSMQGIIDYGYDEIDNQPILFTWITHLDGPLPGCRIYSSRVYAITAQETHSAPPTL